MMRTARRVGRLWTALRRRSHVGSERIMVSAAVAGGRVEHVTIHTDGTVSAEGWAGDLHAFGQTLELRINDRSLPPTFTFRTRRRVGVSLVTGQGTFLGAVVEWVLTPAESRASATLLSGGTPLGRFQLPAIVEPAYNDLRTASRVLSRDEIYTAGLPSAQVSPEVVELARCLTPPVLDFGCGAGALVRELRREGIEAHGLELDSDRIHQHLLEDVKPFVTLYDGRMPSPFRDRQFGSVVCSEVLEHLPDAAAALCELVRIASGSLLITVPDMSAIPRGFQYHVVPWHLLESTHVNFFTQRSLVEAVTPHAKSVEIARIGRVECGHLQYYTSLAARVELH